jgi:hypothetical protein
VPQSQRDRYIKALSDHDAVPETNGEIYEAPAHSPWATSQQQYESALFRKKRIIRSLVMQLEFVAEAVVDYDELEEPGWPPRTRRTSAVVVRAKNDRVLEAYQVDAIRNTICGAVAGLSPDDIVVTDISAGHAYVGADMDDEPCPTDHISRLRQAKLQQRIEDQLLTFGAGINVSLSMVCEEMESASPKLPTETEIEIHDDSAPIANRPAAVASNSTDVSPSPETAPTKSPGASLCIKIVVPESCVMSYSTSGTPATYPTTLEKRFQQLQDRIQATIQPLVASEGHLWGNHVLEIVMLPSPPAARPEIAQSIISVEWLKQNSTVLGMGLGSVVLLIGFLFWRVASGNQTAATSASAALRDESPDRRMQAARSTNEMIPDETRRKLRQMVDDNPDQAAEIIKQWIRGAA